MQLEDLIPNLHNMTDEELLQFVVDVRRKRRVGLEGVGNGPAKRPRREKTNRKTPSDRKPTANNLDLSKLSPEEIKQILTMLGVDNESSD